MICGKCNHKIPDDSEFCQYCGNKLDSDNDVSAENIETQIKEEENPTVEAIPVPTPDNFLVEEEPSTEEVPEKDALKGIFDVQLQKRLAAWKQIVRISLTTRETKILGLSHISLSILAQQC